MEYIFIDYDNLVKYLGKYTDFYIILNSLVNIFRYIKKVILITKDVVNLIVLLNYLLPSFT